MWRDFLSLLWEEGEESEGGCGSLVDDGTLRSTVSLSPSLPRAHSFSLTRVLVFSLFLFLSLPHSPSLSLCPSLSLSLSLSLCLCKDFFLSPSLSLSRVLGHTHSSHIRPTLRLNVMTKYIMNSGGIILALSFYQFYL